MATPFAGGHLAECSRRARPPGPTTCRNGSGFEPENFGGGGKLATVIGKVMSSDADISTLYREFTQALTDVLAEHAVGPASRESSTLPLKSTPNTASMDIF